MADSAVAVEAKAVKGGRARAAAMTAGEPVLEDITSVHQGQTRVNGPVSASSPFSILARRELAKHG